MTIKGGGKTIKASANDFFQRAAGVSTMYNEWYSAQSGECNKAQIKNRKVTNRSSKTIVKDAQQSLTTSQHAIVLGASRCNIRFGEVFIGLQEKAQTCIHNGPRFSSEGHKQNLGESAETSILQMKLENRVE